MNPNLTANMPAHMRGLKRDRRGYPIPYFAMREDGTHDFFNPSARARLSAIRQNLCWICGKANGRYRAFCGGPLLVAQRVSAEPASHRDCAVFAATTCPYMLASNADRRAPNDPAATAVTGVTVLDDHPQVFGVYVTRHCHARTTEIFELDEPTEVQWYRQGRLATAPEVEAAIIKALDRARCAGMPVDRIELSEQRLRHLVPPREAAGV